MNILRHPATILILILLIVLLFGSRRLPDLARSVGESLKIFKKEVKDLREDDDAPPATGGTSPVTGSQTDGDAPASAKAPPGATDTSGTTPDEGTTPPPGSTPKA